MKLAREAYGPLYLPIETTARELDAKLLLAAAAVSRGYCVVIGRKSRVRRVALENARGVFMYKSHKDDHVDSIFRPLREAGVVTAALDEEGFVWPSGEEYLRSRVQTGSAFDWLDLLLNWGKVQESLLRGGFPERSFENIFLSGNVRFDVLRTPYKNVFCDRVEQLQKVHRQFVLINTKFSAGNLAKFYGVSFMEKMRASGSITNTEDDLYYKDRERYMKRLYREYCEAVKYLARRFPDVNFVVRPHPSEERSTWENDLSGVGNAYVCADGNVVPWIIASQAVLHTNCTTGIEAFVAGKPVFRYHPEYDDRYESDFPNSLGQGFSNTEELARGIQRLLDEGEEFIVEEQKSSGGEVIKHYLENYEGPYAYQRILDAIDGVMVRYSLNTPLVQLKSSDSLKQKFRVKLSKSCRKYESFLYPVLGRSLVAKITNRTQKFPGIDERDLKKRLEGFFELSFNMEEKTYKVFDLGEDCFLVAPK